jgi:dsRNA-specific ribonuclease
MPRDKRQEDAWIGDAVLCLWARLHILRADGVVDGPKCIRMTSNQFLSALGEPTALEAELGRIYQREGEEAAFRWIEERIAPIFARQEENRLRRARPRNS